MEDIFKSSDSEKNRIRNLHETEGENKKIDSSLPALTELNHYVGICGCGGGASANIPWGGSVTWESKCPGSPSLLNPLPCAMIDGQMPNQSHVGKYVSLGNTGFCAKVKSVGDHTLPYGAVSCPPTPLTLGTDCDNCDSTSGGDTSFRCHNNQCVPVQGLGGQFPTMQDCIDSGCEDPDDRWECNSETGQCYSDPNGQYSSQAACQQNCKAESWNCTQAGHCISIPSNLGQFSTEQDCLNNCEQPTYDCKWVSGEPQGKARPQDTGGKQVTLKEQVPISGYQCVIHQGGGTGQYANLAACQAVCGEEEKIDCINCREGQMTQVIAPDPCPPGYSPVADLHNGPCHECQNGTTCVNIGWNWGQGVFNSLGECQQQCSQGMYECLSPGNCQITANGTFPTQAACLADPSCQTTSNWKCNLNVGCTQDPNGQYTDQVSCETDCCAQTITNWSWPPYQSGNPTCNEICAKLNTPAMIAAANGSPLNFRHKCRYDWLIATHSSLGCPPCSSSNGCCDNSGYISATMAAQYQVSSSPYCINASGSFIGNIEDAMNGVNAQNTPYGCNWLNIAQGNILNSLPAPNSGSQCNKEGRIAWLDELMTTGTAPGFTPNPATMTALYPGGTFTPC